MDDLRKIQSFVLSGWGAFSTVPVFFPFFDQLTGIVYIPAVGADKAAFLTLNSLICAFFLLFFFMVQSRQKSLVTPAFLFFVGMGILLWYQNLVSPLEALRSLGIVADVSYLPGYNQIYYQGLYWMSFASFTGSFSSLAAFFYQPRSSRYW